MFLSLGYPDSVGKSTLGGLVAWSFDAFVLHSSIRVRDMLIKTARTDLFLSMVKESLDYDALVLLVDSCRRLNMKKMRKLLAWKGAKCMGKRESFWFELIVRRINRRSWINRTSQTRTCQTSARFFINFSLCVKGGYPKTLLVKEHRLKTCGPSLGISFWPSPHLIKGKPALRTTPWRSFVVCSTLWIRQRARLWEAVEDKKPPLSFLGQDLLDIVRTNKFCK